VTIQRYARTERDSERKLGSYKHSAPPELKTRKKLKVQSTKTKDPRLKTKDKMSLVLFQSEFRQNCMYRFHDLWMRQLARAGNSYSQLAADTSGTIGKHQYAIRELGRLQDAQIPFIVFAWPAFWWLDYYSGLGQRLRSTCRLLLENDRVMIFDLRRPVESDEVSGGRARGRCEAAETGD